MGLLLNGRTVLSETQDEGKELRGGNSSRNELFSDVCMMRPPQASTQRPELEISPTDLKKAQEDRIRKLWLEMGYCAIEASKDHPYVAALIVFLVCYAVYFCWMFWFDVMIFVLGFVLFCDALRELLGHSFHEIFFNYLDGLKERGII